MRRLRSLTLLALAACLLATLGPGQAVALPLQKLPAVGTINALLEPTTRQVVQRRDDNVGRILVIGTCSGNIDGFQARSFLEPGTRGTALGWTPLVDVTIFEGYFFGIFRQPAGGFYDLQIRPVFEGQPGPSRTVLAVGVGEVFITAGQSNTTNWGIPTGFAPTVLVSSFVDGPGRGIDPAFPGSGWRWGIDPQPAIDQSTGGSVWPTMATNLTFALGVPVGLYAAGCGGTSIEEWLPEHVKAATLSTPQMVLFDRLTNAIDYFSVRGGVRAVLWMQGESDYELETNPYVYEVNLRQVIDQSRAVTGVPIKWLVALTSSPLTNNLPEKVGLEQAQTTVVDNVTTFLGPNADAIGLPYRSYLDGLPVHFNASGLMLLGGYWGYYVANLPGFLAAGELPPD